MKKGARVASLTVAACLLLGISTSSAMAEEVGTKFSAGTIQLSASGLTLKKNGGEAKTCTLSAVNGIAYQSEGVAEIYNNSFTLLTELNCTGGTLLELPFYATVGRYNTITGKYSVQLTRVGSGVYSSPYGSYNFAFNVPSGWVAAGWTNGSGTTASTINFNETVIGVLHSNTSTKLTLSGSVKATTGTGGLLTMSH
jgi:hypothetical protein